jgi:hypothetical protein
MVSTPVPRSENRRLDSRPDILFAYFYSFTQYLQTTNVTYAIKLGVPVDILPS